MLINAVVLAGGRSSRLGSVAKASLYVGGHSLLESAVSAGLTVASRCVIVGPADSGLLSATVLFAREDPPFSGPAAALAAGVRRLATSGAGNSDAILVLACDMPNIAAQVPVLAAALGTAPADVDGVISVDQSGHRQPLAALYRAHELVAAIARFDNAGLVGLSMRALIEPLTLLSVAALPGATDDVDTWEDATRLGASRSPAESNEDTETKEHTE